MNYSSVQSRRNTSKKPPPLLAEIEDSAGPESVPLVGYSIPSLASVRLQPTMTKAEREIMIKKRNAVYSKRKYYRKKMDIMHLVDQRKQCEDENVALKKEHRRLAALLRSAEALVESKRTAEEEALALRTRLLASSPRSLATSYRMMDEEPTHLRFSSPPYHAQRSGERLLDTNYYNRMLLLEQQRRAAPPPIATLQDLASYRAAKLPSSSSSLSLADTRRMLLFEDAAGYGQPHLLSQLEEGSSSIRGVMQDAASSVLARMRNRERWND